MEGKGWLSLLVVFIILAAAIWATSRSGQNFRESIIDEGWEEQTAKRLTMAQDPETGGWGDVSFTLVPTIYATYHGIAALKAMGMEPDQKTITFVRKYEEDILRSGRRDYEAFNGVYYLLKIFRELNISPVDRGTFRAIVGAEVKRSNASFESVEALAMLEPSSAREYALRLWSSLGAESGDEFLWDFMVYRELLRESGLRLSEIPNYQEMHRRAMATFYDLSRSPDERWFYGLMTLSRFIHEEGIEGPALRAELLNEISEYKMEDGSYSDGSGRRERLSTTHWAVDMVVWLGGNVGNDTARYVLSLESPIGGFLHIHDFIGPDPLTTAFSVKTLKMMNWSVPNEEKVREYLLGSLYKETSPPVVWAEYTALLDTSYPRDEVRKIVEPKVLDFVEGFNFSRIYTNPYLLKDTYYVLLTAKDLGIPLNESWKGELLHRVLPLEDDDGGFGGSITNVSILRFEVTLYAVLTLQELGYDNIDDRTWEFIESYRGSDGMWPFFPLTRYALIALKNSGRDVKKDRILRALELRKCPYGFFSYAPCELPEQGDPIATYLALDMLALLEK
ncbi:prenyltransferase/squalene oxidase repeat-containing protein [Palaeococcus ferrophilus]|uniref:prenyltransferase/squalene oxidase repeat-containing protein n=1 Tax=Palaeococcus ferrophilus TaxID=83868 RepID=UPI00064F16D6|nr:hypothetical protein [Palaeococcus ferrophilus]